MDGKDFQASMNSLGERLVLLDHTDLPALAELHGTLEEARDWLQAQHAPRASSAMQQCIDRIAAVILDEDTAPADSLLLVSQTLGALQGFGSHTDNELDFPAALGIAPPERDHGATAPATPPAPAPVLQAMNYAPPAYVDDEILSEFLGRQASVLDEIEQAALGLESDAGAQNVSELKRIVHTLKGESALLGLLDVERLCHVAEDAILSHPGPGLVDDLLGMKDWLKRVFDAVAGLGPDPGPPDALIVRLSGDRDIVEPLPHEPVVYFAPPAPAEIPLPVATSVEHIEAQLAPVEAEDLLDDVHADEAPVPLSGDRELLAEFVLEAREHMENADLHLLRLETDPGNQDAINAVFRAFHTIKGVAGFLSLTPIGNLAHVAEDLLDRARKQHIQLQGPLLDLVFEGVDALKHAIDEINRGLGSDGMMRPLPQLQALAGRIADALGTALPTSRATPVARPAEAPRLGDILVANKAASPESIETALERQRLNTAEPLGMVLRQSSVLSAETMRAALQIQEHEQPDTPIGEILVGMGVASAEEVEDALRLQKSGAALRLGESLVAAGDASPRAVLHALRTQRNDSEDRGAAIAVREAVKVDASRLDQLVDMIGELVIAETMVTQADEVRTIVSPNLRRRVRQLEKISRDLQSMATSLRMVPVRSTFQKMARLVRDLAKKTGKAVEFHMSGEETELDKGVVDKLGDPLVHMIRNSVDHGLEDTPDARIAAGKPPVGNVYLRAFHQGGNIHIEIEDDGRGLNREAILNKAIERGLIASGDVLQDREVWNLIFEPGFSTAAKLTEVSGRGVGMDVVRRNIAALRGQIDIHAESGKGTRFSIRLPLTLAIIDGMVFRVGTERFIVPTLSIVISMRPRREDLHSVTQRGTMIAVRGALLPLYRLGEVLEIPDAVNNPTQGTVMVVEHEGRQVGLLIDEILGQQQIVIKPLGEYLRGTPGLSGGAIMPDGNVGLVLDVAGLVELAGRHVPSQSNVGATPAGTFHAMGDLAYE